MKILCYSLLLLVFCFTGTISNASTTEVRAAVCQVAEETESWPDPKHKLQGFCWSIRRVLGKVFLGRDCIRIRKKETDGKPYYMHWCGRETQE